MRLASLLATIALAVSFHAAEAAEIKVLTAGAFKPIVVALQPAFEARTGHRLVVENDTAGALTKRIEGGERFDLAILSDAALKTVATKGLVTGSGRPLARVGIGVAVLASAPAPAIATVDEFVAAVRAAPSVAFIDPAAGGSSGIYLARLFERLGVAAEIAPKAVLVPGGLVAERLVRGEAALAIHQISEILPVKGAKLVGPLPADIQNYTVYAAALSASAAEREGAAAFLDTLAGADAAAALAAAGMEPTGR